MVIPMGKKIGQFLHKRRVAVGLSQHEISKALGYPNSQSVSNWERGFAFPPLKSFKRLIKVYGISKDEWLSLLMSEVQKQIDRHL